MATLPEVTADLELLAETVEQAKVYFAGLDQADAARMSSEQIRYSPLRTKFEQAEKAVQRLLGHLPAPFVESCIPPAAPSGTD